MARMRRIPKLNEAPKEVIEKNFLEETPDAVYANEKVVIAQEIPKMEKIIFVNNRDPGTTHYFHYSSPTHPLKHYTLIHGQEHLLPIEVIQLLEGTRPGDPYTCHARLYSERINAEGRPESYVSGYKPYFQCRTVRA